MKKFLMGAAACSMLLGTSCQNEEIISQAAAEEYTLTLDMGKNSRTMMGEDGAVWGENESVYVVGDNGNSYGELKMIWKSKDGKKALFSGKVTGDASKLVHMVYPVPEDGKIPMGNLDGANHNAPMTGSIKDGEAMNIRYAGGLVRLKINGAGENDFTLQAVKGSGDNITDESVIDGYYEFNPLEGSLEFKENPQGTGSKTVTVTNIPAHGVIYLPVNTEAKKGAEDVITVTLTDEEGNNVSAPVKVAKGGATESKENSFPVVNYDEEQGMVSPNVNNMAQFMNAVAVGGDYVLNCDIDTTGIIFLDKNFTLDGNGHTIASSANRIFRIKEDGINVGMKNLSMVSNATRVGVQDIRGISIDSSLEGVGLALDTCSVEFTDENAHDWSYAVNVTGNATDCEININGGTYEGANVINVYGTGHDITVNNAVLTSLYQVNVQYKGVCIALHKDKSSPESRDIVLEVNGTTFNGEHAVPIENHGGPDNEIRWNVDNVDNTKVYALQVKDRIYQTLDAAAAAGDSIKLLDHVNTKETFIVKADKELVIDLNGHEIISKAETGIVNSGNLTIMDSENLGNGAVKAGKTAICHQKGNLVIKGGYYQAYNSGLKVLSGNVYIYKGDFFAVAGTFNADKEVVGAAISVESMGNFHGGHIRTKEGRFKGVYALYLKEDIILSVHGGTFIGKIYGKNQKKFIGTGIFSENPTVDTDYLNESANIDKNQTTGMWEATWNRTNWWN